MRCATLMPIGARMKPAWSKILDILPKVFLFNADGMQDDCVRIAFRPNPAFTPSSYDERIVHGLAGTILVRMPAERLCGIEGHLIDRVSFGFGILGHLEKDSRFRVTRNARNSHRLEEHQNRGACRRKDSSAQEHLARSGCPSLFAEPLPPHLSLAEAAALTWPGTP